MTSLVTKNFRLYNTDQLYSKITTNATENLYLTIGKTTAWPNDSIPPVVNSSFDSIAIDTWKYAISMKKIVGSDASYAVPRINWTSGVTYNSYKSYTDFATNFYVLTDEFNLYKCIDNNNNSPSTVKPTSTSTAIVSLADNYKWKFMFTLRAVDALKYLTTSYIPVKYLTVNDGSDQWLVQTSAVPGTIDTYSVLVPGTGYISQTGTAVTATPTTITLASSASAIDSTYNGMSVYISSGQGQGQVKKISSYIGATKIATVETWNIIPNATSIYTVSPSVNIVGDGTGASAYSTVTSGAITKINTLSFGSNYKHATVTLQSNVGGNAVIKANVSPLLGHGSNVVRELFAHNLTLNVKLTGDESTTFPINNDYRTISLISAPRIANNSYAASLSYDLSDKLTFTGITGSFLNDENVTGSVSGATGNIISINGNILSLNNMFKMFSVGDIITGSVSGATAVFSNYALSPVKKYSGEVIFINYTTPTYRSSLQTEDYRITVNF